MAKQFLHLSPDERKNILELAAPALHREPVALEKDIWVCWALQSVFSLPDAHPMAFKGGTSLAKVYGAINRLSEDVDITLDYRKFGDDFDPFSEGVSKKAVRRFAERLKEYVCQYANDVIIPHITAQLNALPEADKCKVSLWPDGETIQVSYPAVIEESSDYVKPDILLELGGRNDIDPHARHVVQPDITELMSDLVFPASEVTVLSAERTFWEKAVLAHVECHRDKVKTNAHRLSRHWYDLKKLAEHDSGKAAIHNRDLLEKIVRHQKVFFHASYANYDACLANRFRLIPDDEALLELGKDYDRMRHTRMLYDDPQPTFDEIITSLRDLEHQLNSG